MEKTTVIIVDDHPLVREGLSRILQKEQWIEVVDEAENSEQAVMKVAQKNPDVVTVDISLEENMSGIQLIQSLSKRFPSIKIVVISMHESAVFAERSVKAGAHAYVTKKEAGRDIANVIREVLAGKLYIENRLSDRLMHNLLRGGEGETEPDKILSNRELEYYSLLGNGFTASEIARRMSVSINAVESYRRRIKDKLAIDNAALLSRSAVKWVINRGINID
ncbi:MAG: response regulator transcription factor [Spirochaetes bacterium]|nr:response regulator transcription factor [Spirochaetota bacterium]